MRRREEADGTQSISHGESSTESHIRDVTSGGEFGFNYVSLEVTRIIEPILKALSEAKNPHIIKEVRELVSIMINIIIKLNRSNFDTSNLPSMVAANLEDGSLLIEWLFYYYRIGFVIEGDPKESIWYLVSKSESSDSNQWGSLADIDKMQLLTKLASHVVLNS